MEALEDAEAAAAAAVGAGAAAGVVAVSVTLVRPIPLLNSGVLLPPDVALALFWPAWLPRGRQATTATLLPDGACPPREDVPN